MTSKPNNQYFQLATLILFLCLVFCKSSSARPLANDFSSQNLASENEKDSSFKPCSGGDEMGSHRNYKNFQMKEAPATQLGKVGGIFGALVMNVLPKGTTPPSGPSRRNNGIQT